MFWRYLVRHNIPSSFLSGDFGHLLHSPNLNISYIYETCSNHTLHTWCMLNMVSMLFFVKTLVNTHFIYSADWWDGVSSNKRLHYGAEPLVVRKSHLCACTKPEIPISFFQLWILDVLYFVHTFIAYKSLRKKTSCCFEYSVVGLTVDTLKDPHNRAFL